MGIDAKEVVVYVRKAVTFSIKTWFRSLRDHPFVWVMVFGSLLLYRFFPSLFSFLVSSSPVIVCTAILLGTLLSFGQPNIPEVEEEEKRTQEISSLKAGVVNDDRVVQKDESVELDTHVEKTSEIHTKDNRDIGEGELEALFGRAVAVESPHREIHREKKVVEEREFHGETIAEGVAEVGEAVENQSVENRNSLKVKIDKPVGNAVDTHLDGRFDSSLGSPWNAIDDHDGASDSDSDGAESSSPDASMSEIMPMLDELHPLLDAKAQKPAHASVTAPDAMSQGSSSDHELEASSNQESDDGSGELVEEAENRTKEEAQEDRTTVVVKWTEDDEKNLNDLGTSEIERNQRLENLIAKRIARKQRVQTEKNLIDLDSNEPADPAQVGNSIPEELSHLQVLIPSFTTTKRSPFDLPNDSPVPGSAPPVLQPRKNPFYLPDDLDNERSIPTAVNLGQQEFLTAQQRDMFFRRHESFTLGASFPGEIKQAKHDSRFKPYFVPEETNYTTYQRQSSEKSDSKGSSVPETDTSSVVDQEDRKELLKQELHLEGEPISPTNSAAKLVEQERPSAEEEDSVDTEQDQSDDDIEFHEMGYDASISNTINNDNSVSEKMNSSMEHDSSQVGADMKEIYKESISSSSDVNEKNFKTNTDEGSGSHGPMGIDSSKWSNESVQSTIADPDILSRDVDGVDGGRSVEPVYDSSPSATEKSLSNVMSVEDDLFCVDKGIRSSTSSMASDMHVGVSGGGLSPMLVVANSSAKDGESTSIDGNAKEEIASSNERPWVASPNLSAVDENELRSNKVSAISEIDVIQTGFAGVRQSHDDSTAPASLLQQVFPESTLSLSGTKVTADGLMSTQASELSTEARVSNKETQGPTVEEINNQRIITAEDDEADRIKDGDEGLLSELDDADDFRVDELRSDVSEAKKKLQSDAQLGEISATSGAVPLVHTGLRESFSELQVLEARSVEDIDIALQLVSKGKQSKSSDSQLVEDQSQMMISEVGSSESADRGQWVEESSSGLQELEARNVTDFDLGFKQLHEGEVERPIVAESKEDKLMVIRTDEDGISNPLEINSELQVIEARSLEDIDSALKQLHQGDLQKSASLESIDVKLVASEAVSPALTQDEKHYEPKNVDSDLQVVEASSCEEIYSALKPRSDVNVNEHLKLMQDEDRSVELEATERHIEPVTVPVLAAPKEPMAFIADKITEELSAEKSNNNVEEKSDELSSSPQLFSKREKKTASGKSSPSSRSSSSSSDSD